MRVITVVGARPQFIKAAVVSPALEEAGIDERILDTGQHYDSVMSSDFITELTIPVPTWSLEIGSASHGRQTGAMLAAIEAVIAGDRPDAVVVYGDTNSTLAGALAAAKLNVPVAHVEAGLRSFNRHMPEEINRILTDHVSTLLFTPSDVATRNLAAEGIAGSAVVQVGDVLYDLAMRVSGAAAASTVLESIGVAPREFVLVTVHRAENTDDPARFASILGAVGQLATDTDVVWPVHPRTRDLLARADVSAGVHLIDPVGYVDMVALELGCSVVLTDSGGVQKEAFFHGRPCVVVRDQTEWVELVELGWATVVSPSDPSLICQAVLGARSPSSAHGYPYGRGDAAIAIARVLAEGAR